MGSYFLFLLPIFEGKEKERKREREKKRKSEKKTLLLFLSSYSSNKGNQS